MASPTSGAKPSPSDDWPAQAADQIVSVVGKVRDATTEKAIGAARGVVYGLLLTVLGLAAFVLLCVLVDRIGVAAVREILSSIGHDRPGRANWMVELILGIAFFVGGWFLWRKANHSVAE
jgi:uncharacterized membrane protein HdeD (DUF308 family)